MRSKLFVILLAAMYVLSASATEPWPDDLWLGRGGFWSSRLSVSVENTSDIDWNGETLLLPVGTDPKLVGTDPKNAWTDPKSVGTDPKSVGTDPMVGIGIEAIRVVDERGVQLEYGIWNKKKTRLLTTGTVPKDGYIAIPVVCKAKKSTHFTIYYDNPQAWGLGDFWSKNPKKAVTGRVSIGAVEKNAYRAIGENATWLRNSNWLCRVPVRITNFSDADIPSAVASFPLSEAVHATRNPIYELTCDDKKIETVVLGNRVLFKCSLPAHSVTTYYLYVSDAKATIPEDAIGIITSTDSAVSSKNKKSSLKSALGSTIPSDQILIKDVKVVGEDVFEKLFKSSANLVKNPSFEEGEKNWYHNHRKDVAFAIAEGGRFGGHFAKMSIPAGTQANWCGWHQRIPVQAGRTYLYGAFISGDNLAGYATAYVHLKTANDKLVSGGMLKAGRGIVGTAPWTPVFGTFHASDDVRQAVFQLTMYDSGTVAHDGVLVAEYKVGHVGEIESAPAESGDVALRVEQVDPIVKVFRETPVFGQNAKPFAISMARNETEPLQLASRSSRAIKDLQVIVEPPVCAADPKETLAVMLGRVDFVPVDWPTAYYGCTTPEWELRYPRTNGQSDGWSGWWPDPIAPSNSVSLAANQTQPWWVSVKTTAATKPGLYRGRILWRSDGKVLRTDNYTVRVWKFALPETPSFPAIYDIRLQGKKWNALGDDRSARTEKLWAFMAEKKVCPDTLGDNVKFAKDKNGKVTADFAEYDRLAERYFNHYKFPHSYTPRIFYCFGWAMPPKKFLGEDPYEGAWPYDGAERRVLRPAYKSAYQQALKLYWDHVKAKGWADKITLYISDEPHFSRTNIVQQMKACCAMIHEVDPSVRIYSSTWRHCPEWDDSLDILGIGHYGCFPVDEMNALAKVGKGMWWTTDGQMCTDTPYCAVERMLPLYAEKYRVQAYEFWGCTWLTYDPWKFGWHSYIRQSDTPGVTRWVRYPAGDGYLIYPPRDGGTDPVTTIRLEAARDGVEDYAYFQLLEARAKTDPKAAAILESYRSLVTIPNAGGRHSTLNLSEPEKIGELRIEAGELLDSGCEK